MKYCYYYYIGLGAVLCMQLLCLTRGAAAAAKIEKFVVLHDNVHSLTALRHLLRAGGAGKTRVWLYGDMPRWKEMHATTLWQLGCGETDGHPTDCVAHQSRQQLVQEEVERPVIGRGRRWSRGNKQRRLQKRGSASAPSSAVGFGMDLNLWQGNTDAQQFLKRGKALLVALIPDSLSHVSLREAHHGAVSPLMADVPGRLVGVARSQFAKDLSKVQPRKRHVHLICPEDGNPENMVRVLKRHQESRQSMRDAVQYARATLGLRVLVLDPHRFVPEPNETLTELYDFLFHEESGRAMDDDDDDPFEPLETVAHNATLFQIKGAVGLPWYVFDECSATIEKAKIRLAVERDPSVQDLIHDLERMQDVIGRMRKKRSKVHLLPKTRPGRV